MTAYTEYASAPYTIAWASLDTRERLLQSATTRKKIPAYINDFSSATSDAFGSIETVVQPLSTPMGLTSECSRAELGDRMATTAAGKGGTGRICSASHKASVSHPRHACRIASRDL